LTERSKQPLQKAHAEFESEKYQREKKAAIVLCCRYRVVFMDWFY
jgi:hypothetical protein